MIDGIHLTRATVVGREKPVTAKGDVRTITTELVIAVPAFGDWLFNVDRAATEAAYAHIPHGDAVRCGCAYCRNFIAVRDCQRRSNSDPLCGRVAEVKLTHLGP